MRVLLYFLYFCEGCKPVFSDAVMLSPIKGLNGGKE